ncbi:5-oxoprolinase subunit PxpA [Marinobacter litoralis]|uniref:5-oxoprolinase subunit PxpA n=1 Tax=Marinobacter litoralis TaxID=187981 RepID=UPI0018ED6CA8|nr:5-oxoprolinase subunit PxpA [Marinobacter litoralis]MBJ6136940.1 5-oxoprolinase subunit PxpA [Marinobacter litoralis]
MRLNCDLGESYGAWTMGMDEHIMPFIDQANIACGFHAGDPITMQHTVQLALKHGVELGAHPSYPDLQGFGRRSMSMKPAEITALVSYQIGALSHIAASQGGLLRYVKPHGALYNDMMRDEAILESILLAISRSPHQLALMAMSTADNGGLKTLCEEYDVPLILEAFADRAYDERGFIVPRTQPGAVHNDTATIIEQARRLATGTPMQSINGSPLRLEADSLCVHGDNPDAIAAVEAIRKALKDLH